MRSTLLLLSGVMGGLLLGIESAHSAPVALADHAMNLVTAGTAQAGASAEAGGLIVGNSSAGVDSRVTVLDLGAEAQQGAKGLNVVNSVNSAVANTVNIWDGRVVTIKVEDNDKHPVLEINQINQVSQEQNHTATLSGYSRPEAEQMVITKRSNSESYINNVVDTHNATNTVEEVRISNTVTATNVNTHTKFTIGDELYFEGNLGQGVANAGHADIEFGGGAVDIAMVAGGGISVEVGPGVGESDLIVAGVNLGETQASAGVDIEASIAMVARLKLPKVKFVFDGAGCGVVLGSCNASSIFNEITETKTDNSTLDIVENHQSGQNAFTEEYIEIFRSPFELGSARAEYIIVDDSSLEIESDTTLELSDSAQKDIEGMNVVNAISSNVANSTNISRATQFESRKSTLVLNQMNIVHHGQ